MEFLLEFRGTLFSEKPICLANSQQKLRFVQDMLRSSFNDNLTPVSELNSVIPSLLQIDQINSIHSRVTSAQTEYDCDQANCDFNVTTPVWDLRRFATMSSQIIIRQGQNRSQYNQYIFMSGAVNTFHAKILSCVYIHTQLYIYVYIYTHIILYIYNYMCIHIYIYIYCWKLDTSTPHGMFCLKQ